jgi:hypothetical protein
MNTMGKYSNYYNNNGGTNKNADIKNDENDQGKDGGGGDRLSRRLAKLTFTPNAINESGDGAKFGNRIAF